MLLDASSTAGKPGFDANQASTSAIAGNACAKAPWHNRQPRAAPKLGLGRGQLGILAKRERTPGKNL